MPIFHHYPSESVTEPRHLFFRSETTDADTLYVSHSHSWGQVICVKSGVVELKIADHRFLAPPGFAIWLPANQSHSSYNRKAALFHSVNIAPRLCVSLPAEPCLINITPIGQAIIGDFFQRDMMQPASREDLRLVRVLLDQLRQSPLQCTYLPTSQDKFLQPVLQALERCPADNRSLADWAREVYTTERTLSRRCQQDLGMPFSEWRQRLRYLYSISLLEQGKSVQEVALEVGYSAASAFIVMFQQLSGTTPDRFRHK